IYEQPKSRSDSPFAGPRSGAVGRGAFPNRPARLMGSQILGLRQFAADFGDRGLGFPGAAAKYRDVLQIALDRSDFWSDRADHTVQRLYAAAGDLDQARAYAAPRQAQSVLCAAHPGDD